MIQRVFRPRHRLRVVTWNVGRLYSPWGDNWLADSDVPAVARVLRELDADVVLMQELSGPEQLSALTSQLGEYVGQLPQRCEHDRHVAVLARSGLTPQFDRSVLLPFGRGLVGASFTFAGKRAAAFSVHLDAFSARARRAQAEDLVRMTDGRGEELMVVGGDFNIDPDLAGRWDSQPDAGSFHLLNQRFQSAPDGPTLLGLMRLDHVLVRGAHPDGRLYGRVSPRRRLPLGDHDPVICDVHLPDGEAVDLA